MITIRSFRESLLRTLGMLQRARAQTRFHPHHFDAGSLPIRKLKASSVPRDPASVDMMVIHVTDVVGGFGVARSAVKRWLTVLADPFLRGIPAGLLADLAAAGHVASAGTGGIERYDHSIPWHVPDPQATAELLALLERYRDTPYHEIASQTGIVVANRDLAQRSYHAGLGNDGAGLAIDCGCNEALSDTLIETGRAAMRMLETCMRFDGVADPIVVAPHRSFDASRRRDPDYAVWREIVLPVVRASGGDLVIDYRLKRGRGLPIPRSWDPDALFDDRGRLL